MPYAPTMHLISLQSCRHYFLIAIQMNTAKDLPIIAFASGKEWEDWLVENHVNSNGIRLKFAKKNSGIATVTYDEKAKAFFETLNKANTYAIAWRLQTAKKPETREKRMKAIPAMMAKGEKFH